MLSKKSTGVGVIVLLILFLDQWSKIYVKTHFVLGEAVKVFDWFLISFVENEGAAWGLKLPGIWGKLVLTVFRIFAVFMIGYWLKGLLTKSASRLLIFSVAFIFAGAIGNILDSVFYGVLFGDSSAQVANMFPEEPYSTWFYGKVVDMFYFPLFKAHWPDWIPLIGGEPFEFFRYVFNVSDVAITFGGVGLFFAFKKQKKVE